MSRCIASPLTCEANDDDNAAELCGAPAVVVDTCEWCGHVVGTCSPAHAFGAITALRGHQLLMHPEQMPHAVALIATDADRRNLLFSDEKLSPGYWGALANAVRAAIAPPVHMVDCGSLAPDAVIRPLCGSPRCLPGIGGAQHVLPCPAAARLEPVAARRGAR